MQLGRKMHKIWKMRLSHEIWVLVVYIQDRCIVRHILRGICSSDLGLGQGFPTHDNPQECRHTLKSANAIADETCSTQSLRILEYCCKILDPMVL